MRHRMRLLLQLLVLAALQQRATAVCPNYCSGHGTCGPENTCACNDGWTAAVDCSLRNCPLGVAWADKAYATDKAHADVECSGAGTCDGETGECQCFTPYVGSACQRLRCPNDCSSHGVCMTMADVVRYYGALGSTYDNWDKDRWVSMQIVQHNLMKDFFCRLQARELMHSFFLPDSLDLALQ
eukprot:TRINITY_DN15552_c0_g1_i1.p1 TRINITY_DN15552_c0_g1~~TRINITY_DN15552_c0_g1_i1.p1  ORF type:complete len:183 (+),score=17.30 TRINITY_DN15552_c0_g1_i1:191-739(+)